MLDRGVYVAGEAIIEIFEVAWPLVVYARDGGRRKVALLSALSSDLNSGGFSRKQ